MTDQPEPDATWNTCPAPADHEPHPWHDPWPLPNGQSAHCPGRPTPARPTATQAAEPVCGPACVETAEQQLAAIVEVARTKGVISIDGIRKITDPPKERR